MIIVSVSQGGLFWVEFLKTNVNINFELTIHECDEHNNLYEVFCHHFGVKFSPVNLLNVTAW